MSAFQDEINENENEEIDYTNTVFPPLPSLDEITLEKFRGPLPESNMVVEGIYAGAFPGDIIEAYNDLNLIQILNKRIEKFVCLQSEYESRCPKFRWLKNGFRPYFNDVEKMLQNKEKYELLHTDVTKATFEHLPIKDLKTTDDYKILALAKRLVKDYHNGIRMYIHCWGGHGRTGVLVCIMLYLITGLSADEIFAYCGKVHSQRDQVANIFIRENKSYKPVTSPQTQEQFIQVRRIIDKHRFNTGLKKIEYFD